MCGSLDSSCGTSRLFLQHWNKNNGIRKTNQELTSCSFNLQPLPWMWAALQLTLNVSSPSVWAHLCLLRNRENLLFQRTCTQPVKMKILPFSDLEFSYLSTHISFQVAEPAEMLLEQGCWAQPRDQTSPVMIIHPNNGPAFSFFR